MRGLILVFFLQVCFVYSAVNLDYAYNNGRMVREISLSNVLTARGRKAKIMVFDGLGSSMQLPLTPDPVIVVNGGCTLILRNKRLIGFRPEHVSLRGPDSKFLLGDGVSIDLEQDVVVTKNISIVGDVTFNGNGKAISFLGDGALTVFYSATCAIKDCLLKGLGDFTTSTGVSISRLKCEDNAHLILSDTRCMLENSWSFTTGRLHFFADVSMTSSWATFKYLSGGVSDVNSNARLSFNGGMTFSYESSASESKFVLLDPSAVLAFNEASLVTGRNGMNVMNGKIFVSGTSTFNLESALPNPGLTILPPVVLTVLSGTNLKVAGLIAHGAS